MAKLYTRSGDDGFCETASGSFAKSDTLICLIGTLDEAQAALGGARTYFENCEDIKEAERILSEMMGELAGGAPVVCSLPIEEMIDKYNVEFASFTLPGENKPSAYLNLARCIVRRAEREAVSLLFERKIRKELYCCINRLSDLLYAMSIYAEKIQI